MPLATQAAQLKTRAKARRDLVGRKGLRRRPPLWLHPDNAARAYRNALQALVARAHAAVLEFLPQMVAAVMRTRHDAGPSSSDDFDLERLRDVGDLEVDAAARRMVDDVVVFNRTQFKRVVKTVIGVDPLINEPWLQPMLAATVKDNLALASSLTQKFRAEAEGVFTAALRQGVRAEALEDEVRSGLLADIRARADVADSRATLIARDQVSKLNGALTQRRQEAIGVTSYIWRTAQDERVRPEHAEREGKEFDWDDPPEDGAPGEAIQCRCTAEMVLPDDLLDQD